MLFMLLGRIVMLKSGFPTYGFYVYHEGAYGNSNEGVGEGTSGMLGFYEIGRKGVHRGC